MLNRHLNFSIALTLLLVPSLVLAYQIEPNIEKMPIQTTSNSAIGPNPVPQSDSAQLIANHGSNQRRNRSQRRRRGTIAAPVRNATTGTVQMRQSIDGIPSATVTQQQQSVQCSAEGITSTVTQSSTTTVNGNTVSSQTHTNCN